MVRFVKGAIGALSGQRLAIVLTRGTMKPILRPVVEDAVDVTNEPWTILDKGRPPAGNAPMVQSVLRHLQPGGGFFNGQ